MDVLLSWPVYGAWFTGPGRGRIEAGGAAKPAAVVPEPRPDLAGTRRVGLVWPAVRLDERQRAVVRRDLVRIAGLRRFRLRVALVAADHVHVLLSCADGRDLPRLVQLVKGATSRALSVAAGDPPAVGAAGRLVRHQRWWSHQHSAIVVDGRTHRRRLMRQLRDCRGRSSG